MPEKVQRAMSVPLIIPVWSVVCFIVAGGFGFGIMYNKLDTLVEANKKVDTIYERQAISTAAVQGLQQVSQIHETRISTLERERFK